MDNSVGDAVNRWATPIPAATAVCGGGVVLLVAAWLAAPDRAGAVMMAVAGVLLLGVGGYALAIRPRLVVDSNPPRLTVRTITGTRTHDRAQVARIRLLSMRRIGRRVGQLEIETTVDGQSSDADTHLTVFGRWDLGADLIDVVDELRRAGFVVEDVRD
ncbi:PH domain-containing protein [Gordonia sp. ABSL1-1]|uniref:PH domain-containing protein n=1 Tax=Gordonia sp. ABSL1-1 TaxID=3053923 RepID=UPI002573CC16|nr:PH domain-containing protein [Gordonia sp. ABSL1-1]MDL9936640.1 PH domain-containing protein [Gordonia sp. ABSL1-1]